MLLWDYLSLSIPRYVFHTSIVVLIFMSLNGESVDTSGSVDVTSISWKDSNHEVILTVDYVAEGFCEVFYLPTHSYVMREVLESVRNNVVGGKKRLQPIGVKLMQPQLKQVNATGVRQGIHGRALSPFEITCRPSPKVYSYYRH